MGVDNVLAIGGAASGSVLLIVLGLAISVPIIVWGSHLVIRLVDRYPSVILLGGAVLAWTAYSMIVREPLLAAWFADHPATKLVAAILVFSISLAPWCTARLADERKPLVVLLPALLVWLLAFEVAASVWKIEVRYLAADETGEYLFQAPAGWAGCRWPLPSCGCASRSRCAAADRCAASRAAARLQRQAEWQPRLVGPVPVAVFLLHQHLEHAPRHLGMLVQPVEHEAGIDQAADDVGQRMQPLDVGGVRKTGRWIGVVPVIDQDQRLSPEIGHEVSRPAVGEPGIIVEDIGRGMGVGVIEPAARLQERGDDRGPAPDVGQPAGDAPGREYQVERLRFGDGRRRIVEIGQHEARRSGEAELDRQLARRLDGGRREIEADDEAPRCASFSVSTPKWHCRCSTRRPLTSPSSASSIGWSLPRPARNDARS